MLGEVAALPVWVWFGTAFALCVCFALWRSRRRARARVVVESDPVGDGWSAIDNMAIGGAALSFLLLFLGVIFDLGDIDLGQILKLGQIGRTG
jgi:hypothetical protein